MGGGPGDPATLVAQLEMHLRARGGRLSG
jgi:hypothetical protein